MKDIIVIGGGPAGLSAAITARSRGKNVLIITQPSRFSGLYKAERVDNYPGLYGVTGKEMVDIMTKQAEEMGVEFASGRVLSTMDTGDSFFVSFEQSVEQGKTLIIASGIINAAKVSGESELLGKGVSYCATCDGMLYRGKRVVVTGRKSDAAHEAKFLQDIGCQVLFAAAKRPNGLDESIPFVQCKKLEILGNDRVTGVLLDGQEHECQGVFVLNDTVAPTDFMPQLETQGRYIKIDENCATNINGVYAAGDCTGGHLQVAKAVGQGQIAVFSAIKYLDETKK